MLDFFLWMFINLMVATGLGFVSAYPPPFLDRWLHLSQSRWRHVISAGVMAIFCMIYPWKVDPAAGIQIDLRTIPIGLLGWIDGWPVAATVSVVVMFVRYLRGGAGVVPAALVLVWAVLLVPLFKGKPRTALRLSSMGLLQAAGLYAAVSFLVGRTSPKLGWHSPYWLLIAAVYSIAPWILHSAGEYATLRRDLERRYTAALRTKEALLELIPYGIVFLDAHRNVTSCNQAARTIMEGDALPADLLAYPEVDEALRFGRRVSHCRVSFPYERYAGECIVLVSSVPLPDGGSVLGLQNVTPVVRQEREEAMRDRLETLGRLAAMAAHEIKNPLTTIKGFMQLLAAKPEFAPHRSSFALVQGEADHINRVVSDFLELAGRTHDRPVRFAVDEMLREVLQVMELQFPDSGVEVLLAGEAGLEVEASAKSVKQILKNLVANAYEAMPSGGRLTVRRERKAGEMTIAITDTGSGIAGEMLPLIFTPYMTTKATGTGLGLAISYKLATDMGGRLEVASEEGHGSTFSLTLPVRAQMAAGAAAASAQE